MGKINWKSKRVLITGGTGFIGSQLTARMLEMGAETSLFVLDEESIIPSQVSSVFRGNIQDAPDIHRAVSRFQPHFIFHLAAQPLVSTALINVYDTLDSNIRGAVNLLQSCVSSAKCLEGVVFISTDKVYGKFIGSVDESAPLLGTGNPYDTSKVCADILAQMYAEVFSVPVIISRSGNVYGRGDKNWDRLIPGTFRSCIRGERPIIRSDGLYTRDYIYIDDMIDGYIMLAESIQSDPTIRGRAVNFGNYEPHTVMDVVHQVIGATGMIHLSPEVQNTAKHEIRHQHLNWDGAKEMGWIPMTTLVEGIQKSMGYYNEILK